jgi:16S rRNA C967 or C1407 C5-methylase (RsmB/RsmF family)
MVLLAKAVSLLKPGGILIYSTCTIHLNENELVIAWALSRFPELQLIDLHQQFPHVVALKGSCFIDEQVRDPLTKMAQTVTFQASDADMVMRFDPSCYRSVPEMNDTVGFFIAKLEKRKLM